MSTDYRMIHEGMVAGLASTSGSLAADRMRDVLMGNREPTHEYELGFMMGYGAASLIEAERKLESYKYDLRARGKRRAELDLKRALEAVEVCRAKLASFGS
jgi:hypothetical protein